MKFRLLVLLFLLPLSGQTLIERLAVPLYFRATVGFGYDDNLLKFSALEKTSATADGLLPQAVATFDSEILKPEFRFIYSPVLSLKNTTNLILNLSYADYLQADRKSYTAFNLRLEQHLAPYSWLKFRYSYLPDYFLRLYKDEDLIGKVRKECSFSLQKLNLTYSFQVLKKTWLRLELGDTREYYNSNFTEYDTKLLRRGLKMSTDIFPRFRLSGTYIAGQGSNITFGSGYISTAKDRSFDHEMWGFSVKWYPENLISEVWLSQKTEHRRYLTDDPNDPLHAGREHFDSQLTVGITEDISSELRLQLRWTYRHRTTVSDFQWVEDLKSFSQNQIWLKFSYSFYADIFY